MTDEEERKSIIEINKQQFDRLSTWSQFYHDAEIKVNTNSVIIAAVSVVAQNFTNAFVISIPWTGLHINIIGVIIVISSLAALISTLGYWRYYEFCDMYANKFRSRYINAEELQSIKKELATKFKHEYPLLSSEWFVNAHHVVWIVVQIALLLVGVIVTVS